MTGHDSPRQFDAREFDDAREKGKGNVATGNEHRTPAHDRSDSPAESSEAKDASELAPTETDFETSDGVDELRRMEQNAEDGRE